MVFSSIYADTLISIRCTYIRKCKGRGPILSDLLPFVKIFNAVKSLCAHYLFNSLAHEADKSYITCDACMPYACGTKMDISACFHEAFSDSYYNLMVRMYVLFCFGLFYFPGFNTELLQTH